MSDPDARMTTQPDTPDDTTPSIAHFDEVKIMWRDPSWREQHIVYIDPAVRDLTLPQGVMRLAPPDPWHMPHLAPSQGYVTEPLVPTGTYDDGLEVWVPESQLVDWLALGDTVLVDQEATG